MFWKTSEDGKVQWLSMGLLDLDIRRVGITCLAFLPLFLVGCSKTERQVHGVPEPIRQAVHAARPELRDAITTMCTPTRLLDNYDDDLQMAWRLHILTEEVKFKLLPADRPFIAMLVTNTSASPYSRMCAAYFLADSDVNARSLLTNYAASANLRHRFNAARTIQWFASDTEGEACSWASMELVKLIENRSLELPSSRTYQPTPGHTSREMDYMDDDLTPLDKVVGTLGYVREKRAIPALKSLVERRPRDSSQAVRALGNIGDESIGSFLLDRFTCEQAHEYGAAFARLQYKPAVPHLVHCLGAETNEYIAIELLRDLLEIRDPSALQSMEQCVKRLESRGSKSGKAATRIVMQMREQDPCAVLLTMLEKEEDMHEQSKIISDFGRYHDERAVEKLFAVALSSEHSLLRGNAIWALGAMNDRKALLTLTLLLKTNAPPPTDFDNKAILAGRPPDYTKRESAKTLRHATRQDFGDDVEAWSHWVVQNR